MSIPERRTAVIIEDDIDIRRLLETVLTQAGFQPIATGNGLDGIEAVRAYDPVVTTLDVSMPGIDGIETARRIRAFSSTYIVMLTALDEEVDMLRGLDAGADDYLTKPFRPRELRARIEAMLRRPRGLNGEPAPDTAALDIVSAAPAAEQATPVSERVASTAHVASTSPVAVLEGAWVTHRGLRLEPEARLVEVDGTAVDLTRSEFDLIASLVESKRRVRTKADLALVLRGEQYVTSHYVSDADKRAIEVHMGNLRRKLGETTAAPRFIETVRGVGYRLTADESD